HDRPAEAGGLRTDLVRANIERGYFKIPAFVGHDIPFDLRTGVHHRNGNARHGSAGLVGECAKDCGPAALGERDCRNEKKQGDETASFQLHGKGLLDLLYCSNGAGGSQYRFTVHTPTLRPAGAAEAINLVPRRTFAARMPT